MYKITPKILNLIEALLDEGYAGEALIIKKAQFMGNVGEVPYPFIKLSGFCKDTMYIAENSAGEIVVIGRYNTEIQNSLVTVADIVDLAWDVYKRHVSRGYEYPHEFTELFIKHHYLIKQMVETYIEQ